MVFSTLNHPAIGGTSIYGNHYMNLHVCTHLWKPPFMGTFTYMESHIASYSYHHTYDFTWVIGSMHCFMVPSPKNEASSERRCVSCLDGEHFLAGFRYSKIPGIPNLRFRVIRMLGELGIWDVEIYLNVEISFSVSYRSGQKVAKNLMNPENITRYQRL